MAKILSRAAAAVNERRSRGENIAFSELLQAKANAQKYLLVVFTSDRGLCVSYNSNVAKVDLQLIKELQKNGKDIKVMCIGRKGRDIIRRTLPDMISGVLEGIARTGADYMEASLLAEQLCKGYLNKEFDVCEVIYSRFYSAMNREIKTEQFLPFGIEKTQQETNGLYLVKGAEYDYEPSPEGLIDGLTDNYLKAAFFAYIINAQASEQGARMSSMDNATRNAKEMISKLTLKYNRLRQSSITTELIEIIAGAEAL